MGKENRYHDKEASKIAKEHDKIKAENEAKKIQKEKERLEKYEKPFLEKKSNSTYQITFRDLVFVKEHERDEQWKKSFKNLCDTIENHDPSFLASLKLKYQHWKPNLK